MEGDDGELCPWIMIQTRHVQGREYRKKNTLAQNKKLNPIAREYRQYV